MKCVLLLDDGHRAGGASFPKSHGIALPAKENPFLPSLIAFVGGQEWVRADGCTRVIEFSNKKTLQLHQPWCCADGFPSCRSTWLHSCPCSDMLGWLLSQVGVMRTSCLAQAAVTYILGGLNQWLPASAVCGEWSHQGKVAALKTKPGNSPAHLPVGTETEVIFALLKSIFEP